MSRLRSVLEQRELFAVRGDELPDLQDVASALVRRPRHFDLVTRLQRRLGPAGPRQLGRRGQPPRPLLRRAIPDGVPIDQYVRIGERHLGHRALERERLTLIERRAAVMGADHGRCHDPNRNSQHQYAFHSLISIWGQTWGQTNGLTPYLTPLNSPATLSV